MEVRDGIFFDPQVQIWDKRLRTHRPQSDFYFGVVLYRFQEVFDFPQDEFTGHSNWPAKQIGECRRLYDDFFTKVVDIVCAKNDVRLIVPF
ncbi:hypothetical protein SDC9_207705 [bioreactor metagenome]|uniref:Uncharacterized protein n=1 Tax=bioreactor metagenome TaxID=1076179 RepID=A0A645JA43_9ZZZZ